jgi:hypothetical protein
MTTLERLPHPLDVVAEVPRFESDSPFISVSRSASIVALALVKDASAARVLALAEGVGRCGPDTVLPALGLLRSLITCGALGRTSLLSCSEPVANRDARKF